MNKLRWKIAVLVGSVVLVLLLIVTLSFNVIMKRRIKNNAEEALEFAFVTSFTGETEMPVYSPEMIMVFESQADRTVIFPQYSKKEQSIIDWCSDIETDTMMEAEINGSTYYLMFEDSEYLSARYDSELEQSITISSSNSITDSEETELTLNASAYDFNVYKGEIAYIDITGELEMIRHINIVFLISAVIIGVLGSTAGYFTGRKLEQSQLAQKQFFENTSHELKTPLTSIRGYAEGIEKGVITDYKHTGRTIAAQTEKMSRLVEEILCMAKIESGSVVLSKEEIDLPGFIQDCLMPFEGTVINRGLSVDIDLSPATVSADPDKLEHAVSNLLTNALKYARTKIKVSCGSEGFCISNDCEPLSDDTLSHLFERFYTGRDGNTGIGLSLAKDLIEMHGWQISAKQTDDGVCFEVRCSGARRNTRKK